MKSIDGYGQYDDVQIRRPAYVHEGPTGTWPGTVSPAEVFYDQMRDMQEQRNMQRGRQTVTTVEVIAELESAMADA